MNKRTTEYLGWMPFIESLDEEMNRLLTIKDQPMKAGNL